MFKATVTVKPHNTTTCRDGKQVCPFYTRPAFGAPECALFVTERGTTRRLYYAANGHPARCKQCRDAEQAAKAEGGGR